MQILETKEWDLCKVRCKWLHYPNSLLMDIAGRLFIDCREDIIYVLWKRDAFV